jgi:7-cyano-7-deazaguanine synthase
MSNKAVVAYSGGMDSTVLLYHAKCYHDKVIALSFNYNQRHSKELEFAKINTQKLGIEHKIIDISFFGELANTSSLTNKSIEVDDVKNIIGEAQPSQYIPYRNMMLLSICSATAESANASTVYYGAAQADSVAGYWDGSQSFVDAINKVVGLNRKNQIIINAPLLEMSKKQIIQYGVQLGVNFKDTTTCYRGEELSCGTCPSCSLRLRGFIDAGYRDPLFYQNQDKLNEIYHQNSCTTLTDSDQ